MEKTLQRLEKYQNDISSSDFFQETVDVLQRYEIKSIRTIRCLALGSPSESNAALYQLAYLRELAAHFKVAEVSLFDPVFTKLDEDILNEFDYHVEPTFDSTSDRQVLHFLPHADLQLTEDLLKADHPKWLLSNDIVAHTDRYTKRKLFDEFRLISLFKNLVEKSSIDTPTSGEFQVVTSKKSRKGKKNVFIEPEIHYDYTDAYFTQVKATRLLQIEGPWGNAFSDLAFHLVIPHPTKAAESTAEH